MEKKNKIKYTQLSHKKFLYNKDDINKLLNIQLEKDQKFIHIRKNIIYTRVSNTKQKNDLDKQRQILTDYCNINGIIPDIVFSEVASGMNENRIEFNKLLDLVINNEVDEENLEQELTEDLISIIHHFSMKMYSNRRKKLKEIQKQLKD